ncbi:MAG: helix-turn-helix domain-containing protein [Bacteroidota bacterium]|nr:helix-turn-helix domain-containing protein [Bacteroidota bacterium]
MEKSKKYNRIKVVLAEKQLSNHWLAKRLGKTDMTVSRWCTNSAQPSIVQLVEIADALEVDAKELIETTLQK